MNFNADPQSLFLEMRRIARANRRLGEEMSQVRRNGQTVISGGSGVTVRKDTGTSDVGTRPRLNFITGSGMTLVVGDDPVSEEVDVTIAVNAILAAISAAGFAPYFGGSPTAVLTYPQVWWDTSSNPWKIKVNAANHAGVAGWIVFATGQRP